MSNALKFVADESCDFAVVRCLRKEGYDVLAISELHSGADDEFVIEFTLKENRILISEDKDFGQLIYAKGKAKITVLFIRYPAKLRKQLPQQVINFLNENKEKLKGCFVVIQPGRIRMTKYS